MRWFRYRPYGFYLGTAASVIASWCRAGARSRGSDKWVLPKMTKFSIPPQMTWHIFWFLLWSTLLSFQWSCWTTGRLHFLICAYRLLFLPHKSRNFRRDFYFQWCSAVCTRRIATSSCYLDRVRLFIAVALFELQVPHAPSCTLLLVSLCFLLATSAIS